MRFVPELERQDLARGVRAATATVLPFALAWILHEPELSWLALGGWLGSLADPGGTRSRHAALLGAFALSGAALTTAGALLHPYGPWAGVLLAGVAWLGALLRATGAIGSTFGTLLTVITAIAVSSGAAHPLRAGLWFALGAGWATLISSVLWPIWTHLPLRQALASVFTALAKLAAHPTQKSPRRYQKPVRDALEAARDISLSLRAKRFGESVVGSNLRALLGVAESSFFGLIASGERLRDTPDEAARQRLIELSALYTRVAETLGEPRLGADAEDGEPSSPAEPALLLDRLQRWAALSLRIAQAPAHHWTQVDALPAAADEARARFAEAGRSLWGSLSARSPYFRHGVRVACTALAALAIGREVSETHVAWVTVTALAVMQPYPGATWTRALERAMGTVLGCLVTAALMAILHSTWALTLAVFPLSVAAVYTKPRSYRLFTFFLTPVFVLFLDAGHGDFSTVVLRAVDSGIGASIALAATFLVFPSWEGTRMDTALEDVTQKLARYSSASLRALAQPRDSALASQLAALRREVGLALGEAELSLERLLSEPRREKQGAHRAMQQVTYSRRLTASLTTLDMQREGSAPVLDAEQLAALDAWLEHVLLEHERPAPPTLPEGPCHDGLLRVVRQGQLLASLDGMN